MNLTILLWSFVLLGSVSANFRGNFVPPKTNSTLVEGDIVVRETHLDSGKALDAFLTEETSLWPRGYMPYSIEEIEWKGVMEPIFLDNHIDNISLDLGNIMMDVHCLKFL